jgi:NadR type nicotinamide-nucleotide adenylyltransferase
MVAKRFRNAVVIGKFYPPHRGHHLLIGEALAQAEEVYVLVCHKPEQAIPGPLRAAWLREVHPAAKVLEVDDTLGDDDTRGWADFTMRFLGFAPEAVFSSEDYGPRFAAAMGSVHVSVDRERKHVPCSGTMIRGDPLACFDYLEPCVRAWFTRRVCLVGAESTGKTTLAEALAERYDAPWMPEYGREYCELKYGKTPFSPECAGGAAASGEPDNWSSEEFLEIALEHARREDLMARSCRGLLIVDTDAFATSVWHERYLRCQGEAVEALARERQPLYSLYLLCDTDIPWVQDGSRDGESIRDDMQRRFIEKLSRTGRPWIRVTGSLGERIRRGVEAISEYTGIQAP